MTKQELLAAKKIYNIWLDIPAPVFKTRENTDFGYWLEKAIKSYDKLYKIFNNVDKEWTDKCSTTYWPCVCWLGCKDCSECNEDLEDKDLKKDYE